jgi:ligand-binding SRPBCC domain-containing protein
MFSFMMPHHTLEREQWVPRPLEEVFEFFSSAKNLETLTPPWLNFRIVTLPIAMQAGAIIRYKISWHGLPIRWTTEIQTWQPPYLFVDRQRKGPYKLWHHTHTFESVDGGTRMRDLVRYGEPFGVIGSVAHWLVVERDVERIFDYRRERVGEIFGV